MLKKIGKLIFTNFGWKVFSVIASIILWFVVVNVNDPQINKSFSCAVTVENAVPCNQKQSIPVNSGIFCFFAPVLSLV